MKDFDQLTATHYWLINAHVPQSLVADVIPGSLPVPDSIAALDNLAWVDLEIQDGVISAIRPGGGERPDGTVIDLQRRLVWCGFVDMHTHLDKGHIWGRSPNRSGQFEEALTLVEGDREKHWNGEDVYRRMEFGLKCAYAHGTTAIRTHVDAIGDQAAISLRAFQALREEWAGRLTLQVAALVSLDDYLTPHGEVLADRVAEVGGCLGGVAFMGPDLDAQLDRVFELARDRQLNLDFHTDESGNPGDISLRRVAAAVLRHQFAGKVVCGHCCSLATQSPDEVMATITLVKQAGIGIVSLPMCNLYLQDRRQVASARWVNDLEQAPSRLVSGLSATPRWRGMTLLHELKQAGIPVAIASDNCRDPFYAFGDHDMLEVFTQGTRIAHFDAPYVDWCRTVTTTPADLMGLPTTGRLGVGYPADLVVFKARYFSELLSRSQHDRVVLRRGQPIDTTLPDYAELDDLVRVS